jgi:hypothetical protein
LSETVSLDDWGEIVKAAVTAAKEADGKARDWLCRYPIGERPLTLTDLATDEAADLGAEQDILERMAKRQKARDFLQTYDGREMDQARKQLQRLPDQQQLS